MEFGSFHFFCSVVIGVTGLLIYIGIRLGY